MEYIYLVKPGKSFFGSLTSKGVKKMRGVGTDLTYFVARDFYDLRERYESEGSDFVKRVEIFHSPLQSATESAQIIAKYLGYAQIEAKEEAKKELKPSPCYDGDGVQSMVEVIKRPGVIVAHEKDLRAYLYWIGIQKEFDFSGAEYKKI